MVDPQQRTSRLPELRPRFRRGVLYLVVGLVVLLLVLVGQLYVPLSGRPGSSVGPGKVAGPDPGNTSFLDELPIARGLAGNLSGGPWQLVGSRGWTTLASVAVPLDGSGVSPCPLIPQPYASRSSFSIPAAFSITGGGLAPVWSFDYRNPSGDGARLVVDHGNASVLGELMLSNPGCAVSSETQIVVPPGILDSRSVARSSLNQGGATFLGEYPLSSVSYTLESAPEPGDPPHLALQWNVTFDGCGMVPLQGPASTIAGRLALFYDALSGTLEADRSVSVACPIGSNEPIPYDVDQDLHLNDPVATFLGNTVQFNASVAVVCCGLTYANLTARLVALNGAGVPAGGTLSVYAPDGSTRCTLTGDSGGHFATGCELPVVGGDILGLKVPAEGSGALSLLLDGLWFFDGHVVVPLQNATFL
jgi:hypothetical protein